MARGGRRDITSNAPGQSFTSTSPFAHRVGCRAPTAAAAGAAAAMSRVQEGVSQMETGQRLHRVLRLLRRGGRSRGALQGRGPFSRLAVQGRSFICEAEVNGDEEEE